MYTARDQTFVLASRASLRSRPECWSRDPPPADGSVKLFFIDYADLVLHNLTSACHACLPHISLVHTHTSHRLYLISLSTHVSLCVTSLHLCFSLTSFVSLSRSSAELKGSAQLGQPERWSASELHKHGECSKGFGTQLRPSCYSCCYSLSRRPIPLLCHTCRSPLRAEPLDEKQVDASAIDGPAPQSRGRDLDRLPQGSLHACISPVSPCFSDWVPQGSHFACMPTYSPALISVTHSFLPPRMHSSICRALLLLTSPRPICMHSSI